MFNCKVTLIITFILSLIRLNAQDHNLIVVRGEIIDGDTIPVINLPEVKIYGFLYFKSASEEKRFKRLVYNVKKVYPYAKLAGIKLEEYSITLEGKSKDEQKKIMKLAENELKTQFGDELKNLTISQGKILVKLIDRETGKNAFALVQELRGKFIAFFWQNLGRLFGYNLKDPYDPNGKDKDIEKVVRLIESGTL